MTSLLDVRDCADLSCYHRAGGYMNSIYRTGVGVAALLAIMPLTRAMEPIAQLPGSAQGHSQVMSIMFVNVDALAAQLNLSSNQMGKIHEIVKDATTPMIAMQEKMQDHRDELKKLHLASPIDYSALQALGNKQARLMQDMLLLRSQTQSAINAVLTPEQLEQLHF